MKFFSFEKSKKLGFLALALLTVGWTMTVQAPLASECSTFNPENSRLHIPKVCVGINQIETREDRKIML